MSDPARPESAGHAALTELASVIRNVTEQLAGFRRRALAAESRLRELEQTAAAAEQAARAQAERTAALEAAAAAVGDQTARIVALEQERGEAEGHRARIVELERSLAEAQQATEAALATPPLRTVSSGAAARSALEAENAALRDRLGEAVERTRVIGERVRFLRQQLGNGVEK